MEKSVRLIGGNNDAELGAEVGSVVIEEQLTSEVGVSRIIGCSTMGGVGVEIISGALHALRMNKLRMSRVKFKRFGFIYFFIASCNCSKLVIHEIVLTKSARVSLCSRKARTAGPTGSSPAAPPGESA